MVKYHKRVHVQLEQIKGEGIKVKVLRIPKEENLENNMVAKLAILRIAEMLMNMFVEVAEPSYTEKIIVNTIKEREEWQTLILQYLRDNFLSLDPEEAKKMVRLFNRIATDSNELYKMFFS